MVILKEDHAVKPRLKKTTQGRKKIEIKKIESLSNRQVTFSKRRVGLFKKASELCILSGAEVAIIVHSLGKRLFTFGHPSPDSIVDRFLGGGDSLPSGKRIIEDSLPSGKSTDFNKEYRDACKDLEAEKKRKDVIEEVKRVEACGGGGWGYWWDEAVDGMDLEELERYSAALEELMKNVMLRADDLMLIQNSAVIPAPGPPHSTASAADDITMAMVNSVAASGVASIDDYGNCNNIVPFGYETGEQL